MRTIEYVLDFPTAPSQIGKDGAMADIIIIAVLAVIVFLILRKSVGKFRSGQCAGGCGGCSGCSGCGREKAR